MDYAQWQNQLDSEIEQLIESSNRGICGNDSNKISEMVRSIY